RIYDADLPEFSFALDYYQSEITPDHFWLHMQEYQAPKSIDADTAGYRISIAEEAVKQAFEIGEEQIFCKTRSRQRGDKQYQKQDNRNEYFQVKEGAASLLINLSDYLDSGLFLDHRIIRQRVFQWSKNKSVLNLFCYTGSVGVQAGLGGASQVTNVDMSASYLKWAEENHAINQLKGSRYQFIRADIVELLRAPSRHSIDRKFDMIFLDPPSFSNSSKMQQTLDVVRDHAQLIEQSMALLAVDGVLIFSTNKRSFKLSSSVSDQFEVEDISRATIPEDFKRRPGIHYCFEIREVKTK
ncbi:MAG: 23S rRNA (guanine2445-N2)-methyltransferase / 23S rRNA (guanine2069-N7)-methyltransferase, partial [Planctomycetota bacterium]